MSASIKRIQAGEVDGRARSPRYIQKQLTNLHDALISNAIALRNAVRADSHLTDAEAEVEFYLATNSIKEHYSNFDFVKAVHDEYCIARGEDFEARRVAAGIVYIVPASHTLLFSVVSPLSAAIAAGNCVVVELENSLSEVASLLRQSLVKALDSDTFAIVDSRPDEKFLSRCVLVNGRIEEEPPTSNHLVSSSSGRVIALVDRTADIDGAAKAIVRARTAFGGKSPYAPDLVLVNEFVINHFTNAVVTNFTKHLSSSITANSLANGYANGSKSKTRRRDANGGLSEAELREGGVTVVLSGDHGSVVSVSDRSSAVLMKKFTEPTLVLHPITSLDDGIDFANNGTPLLASYHFASLTVAKYTSQFLTSSAAYINHIPPSLLLGPAAPATHPTSATLRYTPSMFEIPCPAFVSAPSSFDELELALEKAEGMNGGVRALRAKAAAPLRPTGQRAGKAVGFFDQGLMTGAGLVLMPVVTVLGVGAYYGVRAAIRRWR